MQTKSIPKYIKICLAATLITLICYIPVDLALNHVMYDSDGELAEDWQAVGTTSLTDFFIAVADLVEPFFITPLLLVIWMLLPNKFQAIKFISYSVLTAFLAGFLKMFYENPRPYMVFPEVKALACELDYGKPSGHALCGSTTYVALFVTVFLPYLRAKLANNQSYLNRRTAAVDNDELDKPLTTNNDNETDSNSEKPNHVIRVTVGWLMVFGLIFAIGCSRVYLGVHTYAQIILGWLYATNVCLYGNWVFEEGYIRYLYSLIRKQWEKPLHELLKLVGVILAFLIVPTVVFAIQESTVTYDPLWITNLAVKCHSTNPNSQLLRADYTQTSIMMLLFGLFFGIVLSEGDYNETNDWDWLSPTKEISRLVILGASGAAPYYILAFIDADNIYVIFFVGALRYFITGLCVAWIPPVLFNKLNLEKKGDFLRIGKKSEASRTSENISLQGKEILDE
jgi:membrane-associated phospholipid phosphatase